MVDEKFFVFRDAMPILPINMRNCLTAILKSAGFQHQCYGTHSLRAGRACDLIKLGLSVETVRKIGHWKSNSVFTYFKNAF